MSAGIVVGYDGSDCAKVALSTAADIARRYGEKLIIAFAYEVNRVAGEVGDYHHVLREMAGQRLQEGAGLVNGSDLNVEVVIVEESPARGLIDLADQRDARVIVVGTRGESPLHAAIIGSTPQKLVHMS